MAVAVALAVALLGSRGALRALTGRAVTSAACRTCKACTKLWHIKGLPSEPAPTAASTVQASSGLQPTWPSSGALHGLLGQLLAAGGILHRRRRPLGSRRYRHLRTSAFHPSAAAVVVVAVKVALVLLVLLQSGHIALASTKRKQKHRTQAQALALALALAAAMVVVVA